MNTDSDVVQCRNCRASCDVSFNFCGRCGQRLHSSPILLAEPAVPHLSSLPSTPAVPATKQAWWRGRIALVIITVLCLCLLSGSLVTVISLRGAQASTASIAYRASGVAWFYDLHTQSDGFALSLAHLLPQAQGKVYVGWLLNPLRPDQYLSTGPLTIASDGSSTFFSEHLVTFNTSHLNLRLLFTQVVITVEATHSGFRRPDAQIVLNGVISHTLVTATLPLFVSTPYTPAQISLLSGLRSQMGELTRWIANMRDAQLQQDSNGVHVDLLRILYILEGSQGTDVQNLHVLALNNIQNEGDGFGLISTAQCQSAIHPCGYISALQATMFVLATHHTLAPLTLQHIQTTLATMAQLAGELQQRAVQLAQSSTLDATTNQGLLTLQTLSDALLNGRDLNGDGTIDPVPGEAATAQLYAYLQQLGSIALRVSAP